MTVITKSRARTTARAKKKRRDVHPAVPALVALIGVLLLLYPVFATQHNDVEQQKRANNYTVSVQDTNAGKLRQSLRAADKYNADLSAGVILDPFLANIVPNTPQYQAYLKELSGFDAMSQLRVPAAKINLPIYHGTEEETLKKGAGHLFGSSLPVGGKGTHTIVTGHTGLGDATLFNNLTDVKKGDAIYLNTAGRKLKYVVNDIRVVLPTDVRSLARVPGKDLITLITCTPYGINSHRLLVTGERAPLDKQDEKAIDAVPPVKPTWKWWMIALLIGALLSVVVVSSLLVRLVVVRRKQKSSAETSEPDIEGGDSESPSSGESAIGNTVGRRHAAADGSSMSVDDVLARENASSVRTRKGRARRRSGRKGSIAAGTLLAEQARKKAKTKKLSKARRQKIDLETPVPGEDHSSDGKSPKGRRSSREKTPVPSQKASAPATADSPDITTPKSGHSMRGPEPTKSEARQLRGPHRAPEPKAEAKVAGSSRGKKISKQLPKKPVQAAGKKEVREADTQTSGRHRVEDGESLTLRQILERRNKK